MHVEFKMRNGKLFPIEFNPLRFGGTGFPDLAYYSYGINPYTSFFNDNFIDWNKIVEDSTH
jgi:hypothetical protein